MTGNRSGRIFMKNKLEKYIEDCIYYYDLPGLAISTKDQKIAAGYADFEKKTPLTTEHVFHMASVSKLFTATAVMMLIDREELSLDDEPAEILAMENHWPPVTMKDLLTHTSGLGNVDDFHWTEPRIDEGALHGYVMGPRVAGSTLLFEPGDRFSYSDKGYELLGDLIAQISGMSYEEFIKENILDPLEMENSTFLTFQRRKEELAAPHFKDEDNHIKVQPYYPYNREHGPSSTLTTDVWDIEKFAEAHINKTLFADYDRAWTKYTEVPNNGEGMGLSWFMREQRGSKLYGHEGTDDGFRANIWICPENGQYVSVMCNMSKAPVKRIGKGVMDIILGYEPKF